MSNSHAAYVRVTGQAVLLFAVGALLLRWLIAPSWLGAVIDALILTAVGQLGWRLGRRFTR